MTKTKSTPAKAALTRRKIDHVGGSEVVATDEVIVPVAPVITPKERLLFAADILSDLLPTYSGPGRRHIEAAKANIDQAIKYTP